MRPWLCLAGILAGALPFCGAAQTRPASIPAETTGTTAAGKARGETAQIAPRAESAATQAAKPVDGTSQGVTKPVDGTRSSATRPVDGASLGTTKQPVERALPRATNPKPNDRAAVKQDQQANQPDDVAAPAPIQAIGGTENLEAVLDLIRNRAKPLDTTGLAPALASLTGRLPGLPAPPKDLEKKDQREQLGRALPSLLDRGW